MWYHAIADFDERQRFWWNRSKESLITDVIIPLVGKQVRLTKRRGKKMLFNFGVVSYFAVVATEHKLKREAPGRSPKELRDNAFVQNHNVTEGFVGEIRLLGASAHNKSLLQQLTTSPRKQIFVIMKFGDKELDSAYDGVIKPIGERFGYKVLRVDEIENSGKIPDQVLNSISESELVLAELSKERPNCYYEAGYAHALGKEMIFCIHGGEQIHFDLAHYRFIQWSTEAELRRKLEVRLESYQSSDDE